LLPLFSWFDSAPPSKTDYGFIMFEFPDFSGEICKSSLFWSNSRRLDISLAFLKVAVEFSYWIPLLGRSMIYT